MTRPTEYDQLLALHGTHGQARFFLERRDRDIMPLEERHRCQEAARHDVSVAIPAEWRRASVTRDDLDRFLFEPDDIIIAVGQDGLVANTAKYLDGQPVIGVNPDAAVYEGVLVRIDPADVGEALLVAQRGQATVEERSMVAATLDDGQELLALNELFIGHETHQSARYLVRCGEVEEHQSSSGIVVATGTGSTGWARSIHRDRHAGLVLPAPEDRALAFFTREAWPSVATGTSLTEGLLGARDRLHVRSEMESGGTVFGDGIESDSLEFGWGHNLDVRLANRRLLLVVG